MATTLQLLDGTCDRARPQTPYRVVVGMDFSVHAMRAADLAARIAARHRGAELHLVGIAETGITGRAIVPYDCLEAALASLGEQLVQSGGRPRADLTIVTHALVAPPARAIVDIARGLGADLIVLGSAGPKRYARMLFGCVAAAVKRDAPCPVLTVAPATLTPARWMRPHRVAAG
jgi:nucleotide-binding universal stress UspA family protein